MAKRSQISVRARRLEVRGKVLRGVVRVFFAVLCLSIGFVVLSTSVPQKRKLEELEAKLEEAKVREQEVLAERAYGEVEHQALKTDREFLEIHARDRLDYYIEGEKVLKFRGER